MCVPESGTHTKILFMQLRALVGRPRLFREIVVRPRPTATFPSIYAAGALGTVGVLTATLIGMSVLGTAAGPSGHLGGRIMAVPYTPGRTSPFFGFGGPPPPAASRAPDTSPPDIAAGDVTEGSHPGSVVAVVAAHAPTAWGVRNQRVRALSAVLTAPSTRGASQPPSVKVLSVASTKPVATVVSVASAHPRTTAAHAALYATPAVVVASPAPERAKGASKHAAKRDHATKVRHAQAHRDAKANQEYLSSGP